MTRISNAYCRWLIALLLSFPFAGPVGGAVRIAMTDFTVDDNSYRSAMAAADFTAVVQARLSEPPEGEWVERQELQRAAAELHATAFGLVSPGSALRIGKWVKAEMAVLGRFERSGAAGRSLRLEVVDLDRADVLATRSVAITGDPQLPLELRQAEIQTASEELHRAMGESIQRLKERRNQAVLAPLFFMNSGQEQRLGFLEGDWVAALEKASDSKIRLLRFPRVNQALDESALIAGGLVESDPDLWQKLANVYVWGTFSEQSPVETPFPKVTVQIVVNLWDGRSAPVVFTESSAVEHLPEHLSQLAQRVVDFVQTQPIMAAAPNARKLLAHSLVERANTLAKTLEPGQEHFQPPDKTGQRQRDMNQLLAMACFFDPGSREAQFARLCWLPEDPNAPGDFWSAWRKSRAWGEYVATYGLDSDALKGRPGLFMPFIYCTQRALDCRHWRLGCPADVPKPIADQWQAELEQEVVRRATKIVQYQKTVQSSGFAGDWVVSNIIYDDLRIIENPRLRAELIENIWPVARVEAARSPFFAGKGNFAEVAALIRKTYSELGMPEKAEALLRGLPVRESDQISESPPANTPLWAVRRLDVRPPTLSVHLQAIPFPNKFSPESITALAATDNQLWIGTDSGNRISQFIGSRNFDEYSESIIWVLQPNTGQMENLSAILGKHSRVCNFYPQNGKLWITFANNGVWCVDKDSRQVRRFGPRDGLLSDEMYAATCVSNRLYLGGGAEYMGKLNAYDPSSSTFPGEEISAWLTISGDSRVQQPGRITHLAAWDRWLLVDAGQPLLFDTQERRWTNLQQKLFALSLRRMWGAYNDWPQNNAIAASATDASGFWIGTAAGLMFLNPQTGEIRSMITPYTDGIPIGLNPVREFCRYWREQAQLSFALGWPRTRLAGAVTALARDGDYLWIATRTGDGFHNSPVELEGNFIYLLHMPTRMWVGQFSVPRAVTTMVVLQNRLFMGAGYGATALTAIDTAALLAVPREKWVSDEITETEVKTQIAALPAEEQARYAFFRADYDKVIQLLGDPDVKSADLATLFLLGYSYDALGLNNPPKSRQYFEEIRARKLPDIWRKAAENAERLRPKPGPK